jgi:transposase-like protein
MSHVDAPSTPGGRLRLITRVAGGRPIAHVAAEAGVARQALSKWVQRYLEAGEAGLVDRRSAPRHSPTRTRRRWSADRVPAPRVRRTLLPPPLQLRNRTPRRPTPLADPLRERLRRDRRWSARRIGETTTPLAFTATGHLTPTRS